MPHWLPPVGRVVPGPGLSLHALHFVVSSIRWRRKLKKITKTLPKISQRNIFHTHTIAYWGPQINAVSVLQKCLFSSCQRRCYFAPKECPSVCLSVSLPNIVHEIEGIFAVRSMYGMFVIICTICALLWRAYGRLRENS